MLDVQFIFPLPGINGQPFHCYFLGIKEVDLMTNNPKKLIGLEGHDLKITERIPVKIKPSKYNEKYLSIKKTKLDHILD